MQMETSNDERERLGPVRRKDLAVFDWKRKRVAKS